MMAKFQEQDKTGKRTDDESPMESVVIPVQLPTLSTLSGLSSTANEGLNSPPDNTNKQSEEQKKQQQMAQMGTSPLSADEEFSLLMFLRETLDELKTIDWPSPSRVFKITVIIIVIIIVASVAIYAVDGFFSSVAQRLFETNV